MATGDAPDQLGRLKSVLPPWFADANPIRDALLQGFAVVQTFLYGLIVYARLQTRIRTATGGWLDLIAEDFFGSTVRRVPTQSDASFLNEIVVNLFRERGTRRSVVQVLTDLTGTPPSIFEPARPQDTGGYGCPSLGYGAAGAYGSLLIPYQAFVIAYRPLGSGIPNVAGYGIPTGAYGTASRAEYADLSEIKDTITDAQIYAAVESVKPVGTILWVMIQNGPPTFLSLALGSGTVLFNGEHVQLPVTVI